MKWANLEQWVLQRSRYWIFLTTYAFIFRIFANKHAGCCKYCKHEHSLYILHTQQFASLSYVLSTYQHLFCWQKHWVKHGINMLLASNKLQLDHRNDAYSAKNTLTLQQKHNSKASLTSCVHPPCLVFSSRLHILKGHFEGQIWAKKINKCSLSSFALVQYITSR